MSHAPSARPFLGALLCSALAAPFAAGQVTYDVDTTADTPDAAPGDGVCADSNGACSLRAALQEASASGLAAIVRLDGSATYTLELAGADEDDGATGDLDVATHIVVQGSGATIDAAQLDRAFDVMSGASLLLDGVTIRNGLVTDANGGAVRSAGALTVTSSTLVSNTALGAGASGGAISNEGGRLLVDRSTLSGNESARAGGAIEAVAGLTTLVQSQLSGNSTGPVPGNGGALHLTGTGVVDVVRCDVLENDASREGGGLWNSSTGTMTVDRSKIVGNIADGPEADDGGGGLFNDGGSLVVTRSNVELNLASTGSGSGGGVFNNGGMLIVERTRVNGNVSQRAGGGIEAVGGSTRVLTSDLSENSTGAVPGNGGGLHLTGEGTVTVDRTKVEGNVASAEGGGLWNSSGGTMNVVSTTLRDNVASGDGADQGGGGLFNAGGYLTVSRSLVRDNLADGASGSGGGVLNDQGVLDLAGSRLIGNVSMRAGGGVEANLGMTTLTDVRLIGNTTGDAPGNGGGLHLTGAGTVAVTGGAAVKNSAGNEGGGLWNSSTGTMLVNGSALSGNAAPDGPDVFNDGGTFKVDGVDVPSS